MVELEHAASENGATFVEVALMVTKSAMHSWFAAWSAAAQSTVHRDAQALVDQLGCSALDDLHDGLVALVRSRPGTRLVPERVGDEAATLRILERTLADAASE